MKCNLCLEPILEREDGWFHAEEKDHFAHPAWKLECERLKERVAKLEEALEMVLLYHSAGPWDGAKRKAWERWTGSEGATSRALCDQLRTLRGGK